MKKILPVLLFLALLSHAQPPNLLKDINPGAAHSKFGDFSVLANNNVVFGVATPSSGTSGIWASDGSSAGTRQLRALPGTFTTITEYGGKKYFTAGTPGNILWRTDGTVAGTDSIPVSALLSATGFTVANNLLFFIGNTAANGDELWRSDGTSAGTFMVKDIQASTGSGISAAYFNYLGVYNGFVYFLANDGTTGNEIWKSDGTSAGTSLLKDINPGVNSSNPLNVQVGNNGIYFTATEPATGGELWFSDGTTANTQLIKDVTPGSAGTMASEITFVGNSAYYHYGKFIYKSNGTSAGTTSLYVSAPSTQSASVPLQMIMDRSLKIHNNEIYFLIKKENYSSATVPTTVDSVWFCKTDMNLSAMTRVFVTDYLSPNSSISSHVLASSSTKQGSSFIYIISPNTGSTNHIFIFNPSLNHMKKYYNKFDATQSSPITSYQTFGNKVYFPYYSGQDTEPAYLDLTKDSVYLIKNINPTSTCFYQTSSPPASGYWNYNLYSLNNKNYFLANSPGYGLEFWETDLTAAGTMMVKDIYPGSRDFNDNGVAGNNQGRITGALTANNFYFAANDGVNGLELWSFVNNIQNTVGVTHAGSVVNELVIFPNPAPDKITVKSDAFIKLISLRDALGATVKTASVTNSKETSFDISDLACGVYSINIQTEAGHITRKLIKN